MSTYAISDLHGCYDELILILNKINFSSSDTMYIIGDILDRGDKSLKIIDLIISQNNINLIMGNHENLFIQHYESGNMYFWKLGHPEILHRPDGYIEALYGYFKQLPMYEIVGNNILVHAGLKLPTNYKGMGIDEIMKYQNEEMLLWSRDHIGKEKKITGYNIICGHTPVQDITGNYNDVKILYRKGTYYIDCGCVFKEKNGKLACLRLEDKAEFYVS